jgi:hypothetical protein
MQEDDVRVDLNKEWAAWNRAVGAVTLRTHKKQQEDFGLSLVPKPLERRQTTPRVEYARVYGRGSPLPRAYKLVSHAVSLSPAGLDAGGRAPRGCRGGWEGWGDAALAAAVVSPDAEAFAQAWARAILERNFEMDARMVLEVLGRFDIAEALARLHVDRAEELLAESELSDVSGVVVEGVEVGVVVGVGGGVVTVPV